MRIRYQVTTHTWSDEQQRPMIFTFLGLADSDEQARAIVARHAEETGTPVNHRRYSISLAPYPDCESLARDTVARWLRNGLALEDVRRGRGSGVMCLGYHVEPAGGWIYPPGHENPMRIRPYELYCRVGFEWHVFDLRTLYREAASGARQESLL